MLVNSIKVSLFQHVQTVIFNIFMVTFLRHVKLHHALDADSATQAKSGSSRGPLWAILITVSQCSDRKLPSHAVFKTNPKEYLPQHGAQHASAPENLSEKFHPDSCRSLIPFPLTYTALANFCNLCYPSASGLSFSNPLSLAPKKRGELAISGHVRKVLGLT